MLTEKASTTFVWREFQSSTTRCEKKNFRMFYLRGILYSFRRWSRVLWIFDDKWNSLFISMWVFWMSGTPSLCSLSHSWHKCPSLSLLLCHPTSLLYPILCDTIPRLFSSPRRICITLHLSGLSLSSYSLHQHSILMRSLLLSVSSVI